MTNETQIYIHTSKVCDDQNAYSAIFTYLQGRKENGNSYFSALDLACDLNLPIEQINRLVKKLEKEQLIKPE